MPSEGEGHETSGGVVCSGFEEGVVVQRGQTAGRTGDEAGEVDRSTYREPWEPLMGPKQTVGWLIYDLERESAHLFCKGPDSKCFRLCEPESFCCTTQLRHYSVKTATDNTQVREQDSVLIIL